VKPSVILECRRVSCGYEDIKVLDGLDLAVAEKEMLGIIGPNGSGKTTLFRCVTRTIPAVKGSVMLKGKNINSYSWKEQASVMAVLPQFLRVPYDFTVEEFVLMGRFPYLERLKPVGRKDREAMELALKVTDTAHLRRRSVLRLSGGEQQRVFLSQALCQEPEIILLDEPTSHLDIGHQKEVMDLLLKLNRTRGLTVIAVLHDLNIASAYCSRIVLLEKGRIAADGTPEKVLKKETIEKVYRTKVSLTKGTSSRRPAVFIAPE
jgi:iron complex transport system ATP-binding protein